MIDACGNSRCDNAGQLRKPEWNVTNEQIPSTWVMFDKRGV